MIILRFRLSAYLEGLRYDSPGRYLGKHWPIDQYPEGGAIPTRL